MNFYIIPIPELGKKIKNEFVFFLKMVKSSTKSENNKNEFIFFLKMDKSSTKHEKDNSQEPSLSWLTNPDLRKMIFYNQIVCLSVAQPEIKGFTESEIITELESKAMELLKEGKKVQLFTCKYQDEVHFEDILYYLVCAKETPGPEIEFYHKSSTKSENNKNVEPVLKWKSPADGPLIIPTGFEMEEPGIPTGFEMEEPG